MRRIRFLFVLLLLASMASVAAAESTGKVAAFVGRKWMSDGGWDGVETQQEFGLSLSIGKRGWPVVIAVDALRSYRREESASRFLAGWTDVYQGKTVELALGVRKFFEIGTVSPFFGGGVVRMSGEYVDWPAASPAPSTQLDEDAFGLWLGGGVGFRLKGRWNLGLELRWSEAEGSQRASGYFPARRPTSSGIPPAVSDFRNEDHPRLGGLHADVALGFQW